MVGLHAGVADACGENPGWACREVFELTDNASLAGFVDDVAVGGGRVLVVIIVAVVIWFLLRRVIAHARDRIIERARAGGQVDIEERRTIVRADTVAGVLRSLTLIALITIVVLLILGEFGINLGPLIAGAGIVGIALGFGAQSLVADFLSGIFMLIDDEYAVGDVVDLGDAVGVVESFGLRTTKVRALDGTLWSVRNGQITRTGNMTHRFGRAVLDISVAFGTDLRHASDVIVRAAEAMRDDPEHAANFLGDPELMGVEALGPDAVTIRLRCTTPPGAQWALGRELRTRIKEALDREGIEIPFAQRSVWIRTDPGAMLQPGGS
jgi:small-conductance mechanosensitive channel